jgi:hypothetical protein
MACILMVYAMDGFVLLLHNTAYIKAYRLFNPGFFWGFSFRECYFGIVSAVL